MINSLEVCEKILMCSLSTNSYMTLSIILVLQIETDFTDKLLKIVCDPSLRKKERNKSDSMTIGSLQSVNAQTGDSALDFIKYVCAVLALDQRVQHEVLVKDISNVFLA